MKRKMKAAVVLGRLGRGKPKTLSKSEIAKRSERLKQARKLRWKDKNEAN